MFEVSASAAPGTSASTSAASAPGRASEAMITRYHTSGPSPAQAHVPISRENGGRLAKRAKWHSPRVPLGSRYVGAVGNPPPAAQAAAPVSSSEERAALKIAVCVKEVPDATAPKRIDPG